MNLRVEPPEREKKKRKKRKKSSPSSSSYPSFSSLPDDILLNCLARIPRSYYPTLSVVSKSFRSILSSTELYAARAQLGSTEQCLYVCLWDHGNHKFPQWFTFWINPNRTLPDSMIKKTKTKKKKKTIGQLLVPIKFPCVTESAIVVGSEIYFIGNGSPTGGPPWSSAVRVLNCCNHTWRDAPSMNVARNNAKTCFHDGKIYVSGGRPGVEPFAEAFDIKAQTWEGLPEPVPGTELGNKSFPYIFEDLEERFLSGYRIRERKWDLRQINFPTFRKSECVMMENVRYHYGYYSGFYGCWWYDVNDGDWKEVKGLRSLGDKYKGNGGSSYSHTKLVSCGGKLLIFWLGCSNRKSSRKIWGAEIAVEMRDGNEVWGKAEWVDVVYTNPGSCVLQLLHCLPVSV